MHNTKRQPDDIEGKSLFLERRRRRKGRLL